MESRWSDAEAQAYCERFADFGEAVALRVYTSQLIGSEPDLVLHGGGNTSVKTRARDLFGREVDVLCVKGSGWDLASIEPAGLPAVKLDGLLALRELESLSDENMVAEVRRGLIETSAPNPSVEALLHAFLVQKYVDHSHADAILALTNQPDGEARVRDLFGERVAWVPYVMPGFELAQRAAEIAEKNPDVEGLVLEKHGLFTFGDDARTSYERHIALCADAESEILRRVNTAHPLDSRPVVAMRDVCEVAPFLRGALAQLREDGSTAKRWILEHRASNEILHFAASELGPMLAAAPPITPDHVIRTKGSYLFIERPPFGNLEALQESLVAAVAAYRIHYTEYFERNVAAKGVARTMLDGTPRVIVLPGLGLFAVGETRKAARIAADIAEHTIKTKIWAQSNGHYVGLDEGDLFDMEYWSLEQAKLGRAAPLPLEGQVAVVTGAAGAIGEGVARSLVEAGCHVVLLDRDDDRLAAVAERIDAGPSVETLVSDVTDEGDMKDAFDRAAELFGGVDVVVVNAGVAAAGRIDELSLEDFRAAVSVNLDGTFITMREALVQMKRQGTGGNIVVVSSKNVFAPGAAFGAYSASKAGAHQLGKIAALEAAEIGVRVNMINADAIFGDPGNPSGLWQEVGPDRARARGLDEDELPEFYRNRNLLKARVTAEHVGNAVIFFATNQTPTTGAALPVDGGIPEAFPR